jgi:ArsR family transcriptional regulator
MMTTLTLPTFEKQAQSFKILTHPARLAILEILRDGEHCVCHMEAHLGFRQSYISQQLSILREAGVIHDRRDGWNIYYRVSDGHIFDVMDAMYQMTGTEKPLIIHAVHCECPQCSIRKGI